MTTRYKICSCCGQKFSIDKFGRNLSSPDGLHWYTREHAAAKQREWKRNNAAKVKKWRKRYIKRVKEANRTLASRFE